MLLRWIPALSLLAITAFANALAWDIPYRTGEILLDGSLADWSDIPSLRLSPLSTGVDVSGRPAGEYSEVDLRGCWDERALYVAVLWKDDIWDTNEISRSKAVFVDRDGRRLDRMYFFDNLRIELKSINYDYLLWVSPRIEERGPFYWQRLQKGSPPLERATRVPVITPSRQEGSAALEMMFRWHELGLKPKELKKKNFRAILSLADSDSPETPVEGKPDRVSRLDWSGLVRLGER